ncbi:hypothetical protein [Paracraurococcus ruber]|uniref:Beta-barrel assembly machine subunit BamF n=1 Tax=Paracraurococcus ruber TaxID=77675 RepID=A0ABS1CY04_9PROT|nr:hypothetical protein [Paracraurococcus ruber]MBK1659191.1 hypothetical protein [Paracraurococcus ruber]TDG32834.1 hypothetical protein E2C05_05650 [Paracraurococcus ruber]
MHRNGPLLPLFLLLAGCEAMNQPTVLDRLFEPERYARPAAPVPALPPPVPALPAPPAAPVVAMDPIPDPEPAMAAPAAATAPALDEAARLRLTLRRNPWLSRFWSELTAAQQLRVERALRRAAGAPAEEPAGTWDAMGLSDRAGLVFGDRPEEAPERQAAGNWASWP